MELERLAAVERMNFGFGSLPVLFGTARRHKNCAFPPAILRSDQNLFKNVWMIK
jgi:hypothetical protein